MTSTPLSVADGLRDIRAVALDTAGYSRESIVTGRRIDNTAPATALTDPGSPLTGTKTLSATASDGGSGLASVALQYRLGSGAWTTICASTSCSFATASLADGAVRPALARHRRGRQHRHVGGVQPPRSTTPLPP